ncbi:MAG: shikimate dehydrogenase [Muribaculaceae bacterium]|nr:shikimate dehydrogenase [Muribaculaceae bacterium]MBR5684695.1 shikimate dehydrogenase [Muribaculaceae bacterium]
MKSPHAYRYLYGLIGNPLVHSFSQDYFNQKFADENIDAQYINFEIEDLGLLMEIIAEYPNLNGLNVTAPYKEAVIPYLDSLDDDAQEIGAVNVIRFIRDRKTGNLIELRGYNSDLSGFERTIGDILTPDRTSAMVLGTGGAAKAVRAAFQRHGIEVQFVSRRKSEHTVVYEEITRAMVAAHKIIVNATPLGKYPDDDQCPDFPYRFLTKEHICYDLIYNPEETLFMKKSAHHGAETKNGIEMLLLQAFDSYDIWTRDDL